MNRKIEKLPPPRLPQMQDGGVINEIQLSDGLIYVDIIRYETAQRLDFIHLYVGDIYQETHRVSEVTSPILHTFEIPEEKIPDGVYQVTYQVTDPSGNENSSNIAVAVVYRGDKGKLAAPLLRDAVDGVISSEAVNEQQGTDVDIPAYDGIRLRDTVDLMWDVTDSEGHDLPIGHFTQQVVVAEEHLEGVSLRVPKAFIYIPFAVSVRACYDVTPPGGGNKVRSYVAMALLQTQGTLLPAPIFDDAYGGWLGGGEVKDGINISLGYDGMSKGDPVTLFWQGINFDGEEIAGTTGSQARTVSASEAADKRMRFAVPKNVATIINLGRLRAHYQVEPEGVDPRLSSIAEVKIDYTHSENLPAPVFVDATQGAIEKNDIDAQNGAPLAVSYSQMIRGDEVHVHLTGEKANGEAVPMAEYRVTVTIDETTFPPLLLPRENVLSVGLGGQLFATYRVVFAEENSGISDSLVTTVMLQDSSDLTPLSLFMTNGAPNIDWEAINVSPYNAGVLYGKPGALFQLSCELPGMILESNGQSYTDHLDESGRKGFRLQSPSQVLISAAAFYKDDVSRPVEGMSHFSPYRRGNDGSGIKAYAHSTGVPADGKTPGEVYLIITDESTVNDVTVSVSGQATLLGTRKQEATFPLNPDSSATIQIVNTAVETIEITLSLTGSHPVVAVLNMQFIANNTADNESASALIKTSTVVKKEGKPYE